MRRAIHPACFLTSRLCLSFSLALLALPGCVSAQQAAPQMQVHKVEVPGNVAWSDSGIDLQAGEALRITAKGSVKFSTSTQAGGPEGLARAWMDLLKPMPVNEVGRGALIGRIGASDAARPFLVGPRKEMTVPLPGRLWLGINQTVIDKAEGSFQVVIERTPPDASAAAAEIKVPPFPQDLLAQIPLRVIDDAGTAGDRTNFILVGSERKVTEAFRSAGWVQVDRSVRDTVLRGALASFSRQAYTTLPMSELKLFDRVQDFGYAQGDPVRVVASRHHFRLWRAPFQWEGQTVWVGAGTHDIGFDRDQRNNKVTHKIDPDVDKEREYIGRSLSESGHVIQLDYVTAVDPIRDAKTAHGERFFSDGRTLVVYLKPDEANYSVAFADLFCSVLKQANPDTGEWGACSQYLESPGRIDATLAPIPNTYRVLIVPGFFSSCVADTPAFLEGQKALKENYGLSVELLSMPNDSSEDNARKIAAYLREQKAKDARPFIVLGYSKGTPDVQVALATEPDVAPMVAAFVTVAGASGGSPIADVLPGQLDKWIKQFKMGKCEGDPSLGFKSLRQDVRRAFLTAYSRPLVPTYSLVASSDRARTSKALQNTWMMLAALSRVQDGQLTREDAIVPGAKFLGTAIADHFAVALPFDKASESAIRAAMDQTRYPRAALLESIVRLVVQDLELKKQQAAKP